jgi:hypothetical protein
MKKVILFFLFIPVSLFSQVTDNFETGNLNKWVESVSGHWKADTTKALNGKYSLHHVFDNPFPGNDQVGIPITDLRPSMGNTSWSFKIKHGYDPSFGNSWGIFMISDNEPTNMVPGGIVNGFVLGVDLTGNDDTLRLWKIKNRMISTVVKTRLNWQENIGASSSVTICIERSASGLWTTTVFSQDLILIDSASGFDEDIFDADWFGIYYKYTQTADMKIWVDDITINGIFREDKEPPVVKQCTAYSSYSVDITLDEKPGAGFFTSDNYSLNGTSATATSILKLSPKSIRIMFPNRFNNKSENSLLIRSLCDKTGNCKQNVLVNFTPVWAEPGDIIISEIMADPVPSVSLPEKEYLEIYNRSGFQLNLKKWKLTNDGSGAILPETLINPGEYIILCQLQDSLLFSQYGRVRGIKSFPVLTDGGRMIVLSDSSGNMIHGIEYISEWYGDNLKVGGGWSLEMIDTGFPFFFDGNWSASKSKIGGTPGRKNSVNRYNPDLSFNGIINAFPDDSGYLDVRFSEPTMNLSGNNTGIRINENGIQSVYNKDPLLREFILKPGIQFSSHNQYTLTIPDAITDFAGNSPDVNSFIFGITERAAIGDMAFNEILFNPLPGDADYIEFYNSSGKIINASELLLASVNESGIYSSTVPVSTGKRCILPCQYYTITTDRESLLNRYFSVDKENIFAVSQLPSMPDDKGHLLLFNRQLELIDEVTYNEKMHFSLLSGYEGISLEKIRPTMRSADSRSWHSASEASGWGTPGMANSNFSPEPAVDDRIVFSSTRITPDNDGNDDLLVIDLHLEGNGNVVTISVFDETGGYVCKLADNLLAGTNASITWDGTGTNGSLLNSGIYIILISVFDDAGKTEKWKKVCAVIR